jgi:hypothetical protein
MRTDELRRALDDLTGDPPIVDDAFRVVTRRVRTRQVRVRAGIAAACAVVIAGATASAVQLRSTGHHVIVVHPSHGTPTDVADLSWTRVATPPMTINRIVTAGGHTFAVGSTRRGAAAIAEIDANGIMTTTVDPTAGYDLPVRSGTVNDLAGIPGALIAVGQSAGAGAPLADAWRSTDGGHTWESVRVEVPPGSGAHTMTRVVASNGAVYAIGTEDDKNLDLLCPVSVWRSTDGTDFHLMPGEIMCAGPPNLAAGPAGIVVTTSRNATAWRSVGAEWSPRSISQNSPHVFSVAGSDVGYVAVGSTGTPPHELTGAIWWSADAISWTRVATASSASDPDYQQAQFTGIVHTAGGWIATGWQLHPGGNPAVTDAIMWTSPDGQHWTPTPRDSGEFEQYAWTNGVGATGGGAAILGRANITGNGVPGTGDPIRQDDVIWLGSATPPNADGIIEGSMREIGGRAGHDKGITGSMDVTYPDGHAVTMPIGAGGRFSFAAAPGTYEIIGHGPSVGNGTNDCPAVGPVRVTANNVAHVELVCSID